VTTKPARYSPVRSRAIKARRDDEAGEVLAGEESRDQGEA
jgi:hypothetical protein